MCFFRLAFSFSLSFTHVALFLLSSLDLVIRSGFDFVFSLPFALAAPFLSSSLDLENRDLLVFVVVVTLDSFVISI